MAAAADPIATLTGLAAPPRAGNDWASFLSMVGGLRSGKAEWPAELELARLWYEPHLERVYEDAIVRRADLLQLEQIASGAAENEEAARLWINGLEALDRKLSKGVRAIYDLSATPFFLRGSGYDESTLFPLSEARSRNQRRHTLCPHRARPRMAYRPASRSAPGRRDAVTTQP